MTDQHGVPATTESNSSRLWEAREEAQRSLRENLLGEEAVLDLIFGLIDDCVRSLGKFDSSFARVSALTAIKARNLALACYSISLDGLGQEAGALFRLLLEANELLAYFRMEPEAIDDRLPKAGEIAKRIEGRFKGLRDYLNAHASHISVSPEAMRHLIDFREGRTRWHKHSTRLCCGPISAACS
jgi:hypothetical protein